MLKLTKYTETTESKTLKCKNSYIFENSGGSVPRSPAAAAHSDVVNRVIKNFIYF